MQSASNTSTTSAAIAVPSFADVSTDNLALFATFGAFKVEEKFSFVRPYDPKVTDIAGFRHAVIRYRNTDSKAVQRSAQMVTVPSIKLPDEYSLLPAKALQVINGVFEDEQDNMIRSQIDTGRAQIYWETLTLDKVLDSLTAVRMSQRLNKEMIENWFRIAAKNVCSTRAVQIAQAKGISDSAEIEKQVAGTLNAYCNLAMKLAAPVPNLGENEARALKNVLVVGALADDMAKILLAKLEQILNPKVIENADL